jgi:hypothetical protein
LENSNPGYKWNGDESKLVGKSIGLILYKNGKYINVHQERSVDTIRKGEYKVPDSKTDAKAAFGGTEINTDDLPFK